MLTHPTLDQLRALKLDGMAQAFVELEAQEDVRNLAHAEWLALLLDREAADRNTRRFQTRLRAARLRHSQASIEDIDYRAPRRLDKALFQQLATCRWIADHRNLLLTGPCGLLVLDDWGPDRLSASQRRDLMEIVEDRYGRGSILITSQLPAATWHEVIGEPTLGDAILDRIVHDAYRLELDGPSMRKIKASEETVSTSSPVPTPASRPALHQGPEIHLAVAQGEPHARRQEGTEDVAFGQ
jgi:DNA replication protein DnaC